MIIMVGLVGPISGRRERRSMPAAERIAHMQIRSDFLNIKNQRIHQQPAAGRGRRRYLRALCVHLRPPALAAHRHAPAAGIDTAAFASERSHASDTMHNNNNEHMFLRYSVSYPPAYSRELSQKAAHHSTKTQL